MADSVPTTSKPRRAKSKSIAPVKAGNGRRAGDGSATQIMDLVGLRPDGRLVLWQAATPVMPISKLPRGQYGIVCGHYVLNHQGHLITCYLGNTAQGLVSIQVMCSSMPEASFTCEQVESRLFGMVLRADHHSEIMRRLTDCIAKLDDRAVHAYDDPDLARGHI